MMSSKPRRIGTSALSSPDARVAPSPEAATPQAKLLRLVPPSATPPAGLDGDLAATDRDVLLSAVKARLKKFAAAEPVVSMPVAKRRVMAAYGRASVLECVAALDRLHAMLGADADRHRQLKLDAFDALAAPSPALPAPDVGGDADGDGRRTAAPDPLTVLPNRGAFLDRLRRALAQANEPRQAFAVLALDLEGFEPIQAALGAEAADELLGIVAARLVRAVRSQDLVSRVRGDEFGLFIANVTCREQLRRLVCKLFDAVAAPISIGPREVKVRPSIGIATGVADGATGTALIKSAGVALAHARRQRTGYAFFDERDKAWVPGRV